MTAMHPFLSFLLYFFFASVLLAAFIFIYVKTTPYQEFKLIGQNNVAAAISLAGATLGFVLPLASSIYFTHSVLEMLKWAAVTGFVQLLVFWIMRHYAGAIEEGKVAPAIFLASLSIGVGLLNAVSISY
jgi:putative membrane protein